MAPIVNYFNRPIRELNPKSVLQISDQDFHGHFYCFTGTLFEFFHGKRFFFHGWNLTKIFTGTICISRALFGQKLVFFTGGFFVHGEKTKHWSQSPTENTTGSCRLRSERQESFIHNEILL